MKKFVATAGIILFVAIFINNANADKVFVDKAVFIHHSSGSWTVIPQGFLPGGLSVEEAAQLYSGEKSTITHLRDCKKNFRHFLPKVVANKTCVEDYFYISQSGEIIKKSRPHKEEWWGGLFLAQAVLLGLGCLALILLKHNIPAWAFLEFMLTYVAFAFLITWASSLEIVFFIKVLAYAVLIFIYMFILDWMVDRWLRRWSELGNDSKLEVMGGVLLVAAIMLTPVAEHYTNSTGAKLEFLAMIFQNGVYIFIFLFLANLVEIFLPTKKT